MKSARSACEHFSLEPRVGPTKKKKERKEKEHSTIYLQSQTQTATNFDRLRPDRYCGLEATAKWLKKKKEVVDGGKRGLTYM